MSAAPAPEPPPDLLADGGLLEAQLRAILERMEEVEREIPRRRR